MKVLIGKYLSLFALLATVAWFFWNPTGWKFEWEPITAFMLTLVSFLGFDNTDSKNKLIIRSDKPLIKEIKEYLVSIDYNEKLFLDSAEYHQIKPFLSRRFIQDYDPDTDELHATIGGVYKGFKSDILKEITKLESTRVLF